LTLLLSHLRYDGIYLLEALHGSRLSDAKRVCSFRSSAVKAVFSGERGYVSVCLWRLCRRLSRSTVGRMLRLLWALVYVSANAVRA